MTTIKLLKFGTLTDKTQRFQSQLMVDRNSADFIMKSDGVMRCWGHGKNGCDFYQYTGAYEIISDKKDMLTQQL